MNDAILKKGMRWRIGFYLFFSSVSILLIVLGYLAIAVAGARIWLLVIIAALVILSVVLAVLAVVYRAQIWPKDPVKEAERTLRRAVGRQMRRLRSAMHQIDRSRAKVPVNIFVTLSPSDAATCQNELGYSPIGEAVRDGGTTATFWAAQTAVALRINVAAGQDASSDLIHILGKALASQRPALPANALYVEVDLAELFALEGANSDRVSVINLALNRLAQTLDVSPPVHLLLRGLEQNEDLVRAVMLTESLGEDQIFGGFVAQGDGLQADAVGDLFTSIITRLEGLQAAALKKQMAPDFCAALVNAPFQMRAIGSQTQAVLRPLLQPLPPRRKPFYLHSVTFVGTSPGAASADLLARFYSQKYFQKSEMTLLPGLTEGSVSVRHGGALAAAFMRESFTIEPNRRKLWRRYICGMLASVGLLVIVVLFAAAAVTNLRSYWQVNDDMAARFETYYRTLAKAAHGADVLPTQISALYQVRQGFDGYDALPLGAIPFWLPKGSLQSFYQDAYEKELTGQFQNALAEYLQRDMFAYIELSNGTTLFSLAMLEAKFFSDQAKNASELKTYFTRSFAEEGEVSAQFLKAAEALIGEVFALNRPPTERNTDLNRVAAQHLAGLHTAELIYDLLLREPQFAERVDLRNRLGPRFSEVFALPNEPSVYLVKRGFTREGFEAIYHDGEMAALRDMVGKYDLLIGQMEASDVDNLLRRVSDLYTADYIGHWSGFLSALELHKASDWNQAQVLMKALVNTAENPVQRLVLTLQNEVVFSFPPPLPPAKEGSPPDATIVSRYEALKNSPQAKASRNISAAFSEYLVIEDAGREQLTQFDILLTYVRNVAGWLDAAASAKGGGGKFLFNQHNKADGVTPLAVLDNYAQRSELPIIRTFGISLSETLDNTAINLVKTYVEDQWKMRVYDPYNSSLSSMFPFNIHSESDIKLTNFTEIFGPEGAIQTFKTQFLSGFEFLPRVYKTLPTFLPQRSIGLARETEKLLMNAGDITQGMFVDGKPSVNFRLRVSDLESTLGEMNLSSGATIHRFSHGPMAWSDQSWPQAGINGSGLDLRVYMRSRPVLEKGFLGAWSWFRLAEYGVGRINPSLGYAETTFDIDGNRMALQFDVGRSSTPFGPNFFPRVLLPVRLFK